MQKIDGKTKDLVRENVEKLKELFPSIVKEGKIDFEELELLLGENINRASEQYSFTWNGKTEATKLAQKRSTGTLRPCKDDSVGRNGEKRVWDNETQNLYIEGDNLEVLKLLQTSYNGKIKMIYIDPPYNTGHDFVYKDNFEDNLKNYKEITGQAQKSNAESDGRYHTNWLNMMYPRLKLARNLLTDDGVIFISIDDNESDNLRKLSDEIFGENNFIANIVRNTNSSKNQSLFISVSHEYCLVYAKNLETLKEKHAEKKWSVPKNNINEYIAKVKQLQKEDLSKEEITEELKILTKYPRFIDFTNYWYFDERGLYRKGDLGGVKNGNMSPILNPLTGKYDPVPPGGFRYSEEKLNELIKDNRIHFHVDGSLPVIKRYLSENEEQRPKSIMSDDQSPDYFLMKEFNTPFDNPKQLSFIQRIVSILDKDSTILDFFSGSATTAHAVMQLNAEDGGNRKFICVHLPEQTEDTSEAFKAGYKNICEIGKERIRRAGKKIKEELYATCSKGYAVEDRLNEKEKQELEELTAKASNFDIGFKVLKLDTSNLVKWNNEPTSDIEEVERRIQESMDYLQEGRTALDLVYEIILKYGLDPTAPVTETANQKAHIIDGGDYKFLISSEPNLTLEDIETFANEPVGTYLFADRCFSDDNLLINAEEILKSKNKEMRVF